MRRISIQYVTYDMKLARNILSVRGEVLLAKGQVLAPGYVEKLKSLGIDEIYVHDPRLEDVEFAPAVSDETKLKALQTIHRTLQLARDKHELKNLALHGRDIEAVIKSMLTELACRKNLCVDLIDMKAYDEYMFAHSVNVTILTLVMGMDADLGGNRLIELGIGTMLHDIGKMMIPAEALMKPGPLTDEERYMVQEHPKIGYEVLTRHGAVSHTTAAVALQHHERYDGSGYPGGLRGAQIHPLARMAALADVYDALTSDRPYRKSLLPHLAFEYIIANGGAHFDFRYVQRFMRYIALYPVGTKVKLNTGEKGVVVDVDMSLVTRPVVRLLENADQSPVDDVLELDLSKRPTVFITEVLLD